MVLFLLVFQFVYHQMKSMMDIFRRNPNWRFTSFKHFRPSSSVILSLLPTLYEWQLGASKTVGSEGSISVPDTTILVY